ncbi:MAG TPA: oxidoreductase [Amycolatopsis sp.]|nr:oxidoreductase [Amycolatopsis sp.]
MCAWTEADIPDLTGRVAVVTGANAGLGLQTARMLAAHGARVVMACRTVSKAESARGSLPAHVVRLDLADQASIAKFAHEMFECYDRLDLVINNAGVAMVNDRPTVDGYEPHFGINHLGHMALTLRLLPLLLSTNDSRVVTITSVAHKIGVLHLDSPNVVGNRYSGYARSKLANLIFTIELARRLEAGGHRTLAVAADPGVARTKLARTDTSRLMHHVAIIAPFIIPNHSAAKGALPTVRAAVDPSVRNGSLYTPRFVTFGRPVTGTPSHRARDPESGRRLWKVSLELLGLEEPEELRRRG